MKRGLKFVLAGILAWGAGTSAAAADGFRVPESGNPALTTIAPPGWTGKYVAKDGMIISAENEMAILEVSLISDSLLGTKTLPEIAADVYWDSDLPRWTSSEPQSIAGLPGQAFLVTVKRSGTAVDVRVIIAKIDGRHAARLTEITIPKATTKEQLAGLNAMVSHLGITGR